MECDEEEPESDVRKLVFDELKAPGRFSLLCSPLSSVNGSVCSFRFSVHLMMEIPAGISTKAPSLGWFQSGFTEDTEKAVLTEAYYIMLSVRGA